jgi:hypothetical protein
MDHFECLREAGDEKGMLLYILRQIKKDKQIKSESIKKETQSDEIAKTPDSRS